VRPVGDRWPAAAVRRTAGRERERTPGRLGARGRGAPRSV
jgi:hypothetical protein